MRKFKICLPPLSLIIIARKDATVACMDEKKFKLNLKMSALELTADKIQMHQSFFEFT